MKLFRRPNWSLELCGPQLILRLDAFAVEDLALLLLGVAVVAALLLMMFRVPGMETPQPPMASPCSTPALPTPRCGPPRAPRGGLMKFPDFC